MPFVGAVPEDTELREHLARGGTLLEVDPEAPAWVGSGSFAERILHEQEARVSAPVPVIPLHGGARALRYDPPPDRCRASPRVAAHRSPTSTARFPPQVPSPSGRVAFRRPGKSGRVGPEGPSLPSRADPARFSMAAPEESV